MDFAVGQPQNFNPQKRTSGLSVQLDDHHKSAKDFPSVIYKSLKIIPGLVTIAQFFDLSKILTDALH